MSLPRTPSAEAIATADAVEPAAICRSRGGSGIKTTATPHKQKRRKIQFPQGSFQDAIRMTWRTRTFTDTEEVSLEWIVAAIKNTQAVMDEIK